MKQEMPQTMPSSKGAHQKHRGRQTLQISVSQCAYLDVQNDLIAVVSWEETFHVGCNTGFTAEGVQTTIGVHIQQDWHCGSVSLHR